jgi:hypothetical protein
VAAVVFVYYGASRGVSEGQALFLAEQLERRSFVPIARVLANEIREQAGSNFERPAEDIDLDEARKGALLDVLDQADLDSQLDQELRSLQMMLHGERWPGESRPPS